MKIKIVFVVMLLLAAMLTMAEPVKFQITNVTIERPMPLIAECETTVNKTGLLFYEDVIAALNNNAHCKAVTNPSDADFTVSITVRQMTFAVQREMDMTIGRQFDTATAVCVVKYNIVAVHTGEAMPGEFALSTMPIATNIINGVPVELRQQLLKSLANGTVDQLVLASSPIKISDCKQNQVTINRGSSANLRIGDKLQVVQTVLTYTDSITAKTVTEVQDVAELEIIAIAPNLAVANIVAAQDANLVTIGQRCIPQQILDPAGYIMVPVAAAPVSISGVTGVKLNNSN